MSRNYDEDYDNERSTRRTGFCGLLSEVMSRDERRLFPQIDDFFDDE